MILILIPIYINTNATINIVSPKCSVQWLSSYLWSLLLIVPVSHNSSARFSYNLYIVNTAVHGKQSVCINPCHRNTNFVYLSNYWAWWWGHVQEHVTHVQICIAGIATSECYFCVSVFHSCVCVWHNLCYNLTRIRGTRPTVTPLGAPSSSLTSSPSS